jgi:hypothetical protein
MASRFEEHVEEFRERHPEAYEEILERNRPIEFPQTNFGWVWCFLGGICLNYWGDSFVMWLLGIGLIGAGFNVTKRVTDDIDERFGSHIISEQRTNRGLQNVMAVGFGYGMGHIFWFGG